VETSFAPAPAPVARPVPSAELKQGRGSGEGGALDLSTVPTAMDARLEAVDGALRPTVITPGALWSKTASAALLAPRPATAALGPAQQRTEKQAAFDLLDALTKSGALPLTHAVLHVVVCATHAFADSVVDTVVRGNVNPVERAERAAALLCSVAHGAAAAGLVAPDALPRLQAASPALFADE
jgi:hypothetical protein